MEDDLFAARHALSLLIRHPRLVGKKMEWVLQQLGEGDATDWDALPEKRRRGEAMMRLADELAVKIAGERGLDRGDRRSSGS